MSGITEPFSGSARKLGNMVRDGLLKSFTLQRGSFFALPDAPDVEAEMQKRRVLNALSRKAGRSLERIAKMSDVPAGRVSEILDGWVEAGYIEKYYGSYSLKVLFRLLEKPPFNLIVESDSRMDAWQELNALFVEMARQTTVRNVYEYMR